MESLGFVSPAMVRTLLVPVSTLNRSDFLRHRACFEGIKDVRPVDLTSNPGIFNPQAYPQGRIFHAFVTRDEDLDSFLLHDFEPFRKTSIVIGIGQWDKDINDDIIRSMKNDLAKEYNSAIFTAVIIFNCPQNTSTKVADVYTVNVKSNDLETIICDITSRFLTNFSRYASAYEHTTLRSPGNLVGSPSKTAPHSLLEKQRKRLTNSFETDKAKQNQDKGRKLKLLANFYLMVGNYKQALNYFSDAINLLSTSNDHIWLASAFDGLSVCLFLLAYVDVPFQLPTFLTNIIDNFKYIDLKKLSFTLSPRPSFQVSRSATPRSSIVNLSLPEVPLSTVAEYIFKLSKLSFYHYQAALNEDREYAPQVVVTENGVRNALLFVMIATEGALTKELMTSLIYDQASLDRKAIKHSIDLEHFNLLVSEVGKLDFNKLSPLSKLKSYSILIRLYIMIDMPRKACLMINGFIGIINSHENYTIVNDFNSKELDYILKFYITNYGIRLTRDVEMYEPNVLQLKAIYQIVEFCSKISFSEGFIKYASTMLRDFYPLLIEDDQVSLYEEIKLTMNDIGKSPQFWDDDFLISFEFDQKDNQLIEGEYCDIFVIVNNPFAFPIEIQDYSLSTIDNFELDLSINTNFNFVTPFKSIIIQPRETKRIPFLMVPKSNGLLKIDGFWGSICGCKRQKFIVNEQRKVNDFKQKDRSVKSDLKNRKIGDIIPKIWEIRVVYKQPRLQLIDVELEDHVMLLEGEYRQFKITLSNTSDVPINQLDLKFHDSTTDPLNTLLNKKDLPVNEIYELEYYLFIKKPFEILNKVDMNKIGPNELFHLDVKVWGKRGVTKAELILDYANQRPNDLINFKRELIVPIKISVYPSVDLAGCDIIPVGPNTSLSMINDNICVPYLKNMESNGHELSDFCILALDFMNMCPEEVEVKLQTLHESSTDPKFQQGSGSIENLTEHDFEYTTVLSTRQNVRIFVPIKRIDFDENYLLKNIPSLRNRQFVKDYKTPEAEQQYIRQSFWYRDELLKRLRATWKISDKAKNSISAGRSGTIDIRGLKLSSKMLNIIEIDKIVVSLEVYDDQDRKVDDLTQIKLSSMYFIKVTITNRYSYPVFGMVRHVIVCKNPPFNMDSKVLINGTLQFGIGEELISGESRSFDLGMVFLQRGDYEWGALFDQLKTVENEMISIEKQFLQRQQLKLTVY